MDVICTGCNKQYKIAEENLPSEGPAYFTCPNCNTRINIEIPSKIISLSTGKKIFTTQSEGFESFEPGAKTALVYCNMSRAREFLEKELTTLGYEVRFINQVDDLKARFRYHIYDLIFLNQNEQQAKEELKDIQKYINSLLMGIRRRVFVVYVFPKGNRFDRLLAFSMGVDLTMCPLDLKNISQIIPQAIEAKDLSYKVFLESKARLEEEMF